MQIVLSGLVFRSCGSRQPDRGARPRCRSKTPTASGSSWSRSLPATLSGVTRDRHNHQDREPPANAPRQTRRPSARPVRGN